MQRNKAKALKGALIKGTSIWEDFEERAFLEGYNYPVGVDEAGRGALAGPVVAAACFISRGLQIKGIDDSKKLTAEQREEIYEQLVAHKEVYFGLAELSSEWIDKSNILAASLEAMAQAVENCSVMADFLLIDGNQKLRRLHRPYETVVAGDARVKVIAAASIIAKVHRDRQMMALHKLYPEYGFDEHKGYGTKKHHEALQKYGPSAVHRLSYKPLQRLTDPFKQLSLF